MQINNDDITKKCDVTGCKYTHVFTSGTDSPAECWLKCERCEDYVVDQSKEVK